MSKRIASGEAVKRPGAVKDFNLFPTSTEEMPEGWLMISLLCGSLAIVLKYRFLSWLSFTTAIISMANMKVASMDFKNLLTPFTISFMSLVFAYVGPTAHQFV